MIDRPENVATPPAVATVVVPESVPGPPVAGVPCAIATVIDADAPGTALPKESRMATVGGRAHAAPAAPPPGWVVKPSFVAAAGLMVAGWVADVKPAAESVMVGVPATVSP